MRLIHLYYSKRSGTIAADLPNQYSGTDKKRASTNIDGHSKSN